MNVTLSVYDFYEDVLYYRGHSYTESQVQPSAVGFPSEGVQGQGIGQRPSDSFVIGPQSETMTLPYGFSPILFNFIDCWWVADSRFSQMENEMHIDQILWRETSTFVVIQGAPVLN